MFHACIRSKTEGSDLGIGGEQSDTYMTSYCKSIASFCDRILNVLVSNCGGTQSSSFIFKFAKVEAVVADSASALQVLLLVLSGGQ